MKYLLFSFLLFANFLNAQEFILGEKNIIGIFEVKNISKTEIFTSLNNWATLNYNNSNNFVEKSDLKSGTIILNGISQINVKNSLKKIYDNKHIQDSINIKFNHQIEINVFKNKFIIKYIIINIEKGSFKFNNMIFRCINLEGLKNNSIDEFVHFMDMGMADERNELIHIRFKKFNELMLRESVATFISNIKLKMKSIENQVINSVIIR